MSDRGTGVSPVREKTVCSQHRRDAGATLRSHPGLSEFHLEPTTARVTALFLDCQPAVRPGHPVVLGMVDLGDTPAIPIIGVPGYPVSAALTGEIFVEPLLASWRGQPPHSPLTMQASLTRKVLSPTGDDEYMRVTVGRVGERVIAAPLTRGAGVITSLVRADGLVRIPRFVEGYPAGAEVTVHLYRTPAGNRP